MIDTSPKPETASSIEIERAFKAILPRLQAVLPFAPGVDPAPWFRPFFSLVNELGIKKENENIGIAYNIWHSKLIERAKYCLHHALLSGAIDAHFDFGGKCKPIPAWAWQRRNRFGNSIMSNTLILSPLLPDEWHEWSCAPVFLEAVAFNRWLDTIGASPIDDAPNLPLPHDAATEPGVILQRKPPSGPDVSLTEAATWVAYHIAMNFYDLTYAFEGEELARIINPRFSNLDAGFLALIDAGRGSRASIEFVGRYEQRLAERTAGAPLQRIDTLQLADYCQPIWLHDALQWAPRNRPARTNANIFDVAFFGRSDGYRDVRVDRGQLLAAFPELPTSQVIQARASVAELPMKQRGRSKGAGSLADADKPLIEEMRKLIDQKQAFSADGAAKMVANRAKGGGTEASKATRLANRFRASEKN